jgi:hypothetical protein
MIVGKEAAVDSPREFIPAPADFSIQELSLMQLKAIFSKKVLVSANRATSERAPAAQLLALTDVFHNDDRVSGDAANVLDQRLEHGRVGNVLRHGNREAQIDRAVLEGQMGAIDLGDSKLPGQVEALPRTDLVSASAMTPTAEVHSTGRILSFPPQTLGRNLEQPAQCDAV